MNPIQLYKDSFSGLTRDIWFLAVIYLVNRCGEMVIPFMSIYLTSQLGFSKTQTGIVLFCFGLGALMGSNIGGYLTDSIGNFKVMAISLTGMAIAFTSIIFFKTFIGLSCWMIVTAIFSSMFSPAAFSAVNSWGNPENKTRGYSLLRMAINLGIAIGPAVGGLLASKIGYETLFIVDGFTSLCALVALFVLLRHRNGTYVRSNDKKIIKQSPYKDRILLLFLFFCLINMVTFFQILFSVPVYLKEVVLLDEKIIGMFFTVNGLLVFLLEMPLVFIIEKKNKYFKPMILGAFLIGLGYLSLTISSIPLLAIGLYSLLVAVGEVVNFPLIPTIVMERANENNQGKYMGMVSTMFAMAFLLAPITGLPAIERIGYESYWYIATGLSFISGVCLWFLKPHFT